MVFPSGASVSVWIFCNSCIRVPQLSSCEKMDLKIIVIVGKGSNTQKCWKTKIFVGAEGFWRGAFMNDAFTCWSLNSLKRSGWASDKCLKRFDVIWTLAFRCSKANSFTFIICFVCKVMPYFTSSVLFIYFVCVDGLICLIHRVVLLSHLPAPFCPA